MSERQTSSSSEPQEPESAKVLKADPSTPEGGADYNLKILWPLARFVEDREGRGALERLASSAGTSAANFDGKNHWVSLEVFEAFLAGVRTLVPNDAAYKTACVHRLSEAYGPLRYLLWAASPISVLRLMVKTYRTISSVGELSVANFGRAMLHMHVTSTRRISRNTCLLRQAQCGALPTVWGLPPAYVREERCLGLGDHACDLHFRWYNSRQWLPTVLAASLVAVLGVLALRAGLLGSPAVVAMLTMAVGFGGYFLEIERNARINAGTREEVMEALRQLAADEAEARREILDLHQRQKDWSRILEENASEKTVTIQNIVDRVEGMQQARETTLRGFSHDLRNPLAVFKASTDYLRENVDDLGSEGPELIKDLDWSILTMKRMLAELMVVATSQQSFVPLVPQTMDVAQLVERVRRRLRALAQGRELRATAVATREAPAKVELDPLLFDRVIDNLLTNAVKYTERGNISVEADGKPGYLVIKVSDTGRGIDPDELERTFSPGGSDPRARAKDSYGVGLSVVMQLLDQVGGRLEVMSKPGMGTTFWVHFPLKGRASIRPSSPVLEKSERALFSRVVRIRNSHA